MKITIIFPGTETDEASAMPAVMPLATTLLAALTPAGHDLFLVDMLNGDPVDYDSDTDAVAITVRTPLAVTAYEIADNFLARGKKVFLGGPHVYAFPQEAKKHATSVAIGEAEELWPMIVRDAENDTLTDYYICGPYDQKKLGGTVNHVKERPSLEKLPFMRRDLLSRKRYMMDSIFTTRGCPNHCRFCPVTPIFGGKIRHRPIDDVVAEVDTLGKMYFNVDDSVFGHPQITSRPQENQYYFDLYRELANLKKKRLWLGAGGLSAINYKDGRKILEYAAESGLRSVAAGLESITALGQKQSGAWRKLNYTSADTFSLRQMKDNIKAFQSLGIIILGFFIVGWDDDTPDTYHRTLEFCDENNIMPFIFTLTPMPGSSIYNEYLQEGRIFTKRPWNEYSGGHVLFKHPGMSTEEMYSAMADVSKKGYTMNRILKRTLHAMRYRFSLDVVMTLLFTQMGMRKNSRDQKSKIAAKP